MEQNTHMSNISFANPNKWSRYGIYRWLEVRDEVDEEEAQTAITVVHPVGPVRTGSVGPVRTGVPWARYKPVRTGCSSASSLCSPCVRGLRGPWARGRLGGAELILLHSFFLLVALGSFSLASGMLLAAWWRSSLYLMMHNVLW